MNNINSVFEKGKAFIPFIICGDPDLDAAGEAVKAAERAGAAAVMLGIPFSDPTVESPAVQEANIRALAGGVTTDKIFACIEKLRNSVRLPLIIRTYANVAFSYGADRFFSACGKCGIDAVVFPDLPFEEKEEFLSFAKSHDVKMISMLSPSAPNRTAMIAKEAEGFVYIIPEEERSADIFRVAETARESSSVPCVAEWDGVSLDEAKKLAESFDGIIAGASSCFAQGESLSDSVEAFVRNAVSIL